MSFAYSVVSKTVFGNKRVVFGTYTNTAGNTGGDVVTGLSSIDHIDITQTGAAVTTGAPVVNGTLPLATGTFTVVSDANTTGIFMAIGL